MPLCPTCGASLDAATRFCPKDGTTIRDDTVVPPPRAIVDDGPPPETSAPADARPSAMGGELFPRDEVGRATRPLTPQKEPAADPLVGSIIDGRYRIKARLGQGGVGAVYEGEHTETRRAVAVKVLHAVFAGTEEFNKRFEREAQAASRLTHPSCVSVIDFGRVQKIEPASAGAKIIGIPYLVMEYVRGTSLADRLDQPITSAEAVIIARGVLSALKHAHGLGIVHRDVKPANIMLVEGGGTGLVVKLLDFGLAKMVGETESDSGSEPLTQAGMVFGTPGYLSPEQASGQPADARSDLYALGVVLYEMVAGRRPFLRQDPLDVVRDHLQTLPPPPRTYGAKISDALEAAILKALAKDPKGRWQSAEEMSAALAKVPELTAETEAPAVSARSASATSSSTAAAARAPTTGARSSPTPTAQVHAPRPAGPPLALDRRTLMIGGVVVGALLLATVALIVATRHPEKPPATLAPPPTPPPALVHGVAPEARRHLEMAADYRRKLWCSDAIEELDRAWRSDEAIGADERVTTIAISCLTPKTREKATRFLSERVGARARDPLTAAATGDPNLEVRRGAQKALERLPR
ncbi:MAG: serine/threonine protein kinase with repeat [Myxococcales bacterium]|nr:serine/threonine protein kinase with repeat [Myxococcales bacterium]